MEPGTIYRGEHLGFGYAIHEDKDGAFHSILDNSPELQALLSSGEIRKYFTAKEHRESMLEKGTLEKAIELTHLVISRLVLRNTVR